MKLHKCDKEFAAVRTTWDPKSSKQRERLFSPERKAISEMKVGDTLKVVHPNYSCLGPGKMCSLLSSIRNWSKDTKKEFRSYHEDVNIVVIKRIK
jgi:hypothetical protein